MKTLNIRILTNKISGAAAKASAAISDVIASAANEIMSRIEIPVAQPQRVRVTVRADHNPRPHRYPY